LVQELVSNNYMLSKAMEEEIPTGEDADGPRFNGYQLLAHLLHAKHEFLTADILEVVFEWVGIGLKQSTATRQQAQTIDDTKTASPTSSSGKTKTRASSVGAKSGEQPPKASEREWSNKERRDDRRERRAAGDGRSGLGGGVLANPFVFRHVLLELHLWNNSVGMLQLVLQRIASLVSPTNIHHKYNLYRYVLNHSHTHTHRRTHALPHTRADKNDRNLRAG
jgi:hypothetical protein